MGNETIDFLSGAVSLGHFIAALFFFRFWRSTRDRFFLAFGIAFLLFTLNQLLAQWLGAGDERVSFTYLLRILGFLLILAAIVDKNLSRKP